VFVDPAPGQSVTPEMVMDASKEMASYSRPSHVVVLTSGEMPLNRVAKTDYMVLKQMARDIARQLRSEGTWDS
jgi:fatty-acyl-CoA synthase